MQLFSNVFLFLCFLSLLFPLSNSNSSPDKSTLLSFKSSSDPLESLSSWTVGSDPCSSSWIGVSCHNKRVTRLVLERLNLQGPIQPLLQLDQLRLLSLKRNNLTGLSLDFSQWQNMKLLYLSDNSLSGPFPAGLSGLTRLRRIDLSGNRFVGHLPAQLNRLPHLMTLLLDRNSFTGTLPDFAQQLTEFNVSDNKLVGEIPKTLSVFPASAFAGNENLCGAPLQTGCSKKVIRSDPIPILVPAQRRKLSGKAVAAIIATDVAALGLIVGIFVYCCWRRRNRRERGRENKEKENEKEKEMKQGNVVFERNEGREEEKMVFFEGCEGFQTVEDLLRASAEMLGKGNVGSTYKAVMEGGGKVLVVKRVRERARKKVGDGKEVDGLMKEIGRLRHGNVVSLRAYFWSKDEMLLVYDYMPNGSLHSLLHGNRGPGRTPLDWTTRLKFASGASKGLAFLHDACEPKLVHGHISSSNILVDHMGNACISDFALYHLIPPSSSSPTKAYRAPELLENSNYYSRKVSEKSDVYSFGIVLLEILTGKMAMEGDVDLATWVRNAVSKECMAEVFDLELLRYKEMEEEMAALLQVALLCLGPIPKERPKMNVVHKVIEDIRSRGRGSGAHSPMANDQSSNSSPYLSEDTANFTSN